MFDPARDDPKAASQIRVADVYAELLDAGFEDEAAELRETAPFTRMNRRAIQLKNEHLVKTADREIVPDRTFDMTVGSTPEERQEDVESFLEKRTAKKERLNEVLAAKREHIEQRLSDSNGN